MFGIAIAGVSLFCCGLTSVVSIANGLQTATAKSASTAITASATPTRPAFTPTPAASPTTASPTPTLPAPQPTEAPTEAPPQAPVFAATTAPADPPRSYVTPGAFCSDHDGFGYSKNGVLMQCTETGADPYFRWRHAA